MTCALSLTAGGGDGSWSADRRDRPHRPRPHNVSVSRWCRLVTRMRTEQDLCPPRLRWTGRFRGSCASYTAFVRVTADLAAEEVSEAEASFFGRFVGDGRPLLSGAIGFSSFLGYLAYGYLDSWHGWGILLMLVPFVAGLALTKRRVGRLRLRSIRWRPPSVRHTRFDLGWNILLAGAIGTAVGGLTILWVGITTTFVPEDLAFMGTSSVKLREVSDRLVPLIAHDRVGFGGGVTTMGITTAMCLWFARPSRHLFQAVLLAGSIALSAAIGTHFFIGYTDIGHLLPALAAAVSLGIGLAMVAAGVPRP